MKIAIVGQQDFGKAVLEPFLRAATRSRVCFCAPEKEGAKPDVLKTTAQEKGIKVFQFSSLKSAEAAAAMRGLNAEIGIMAFVLQFAPQEFVKIPKRGTIQYHPRCCRSTAVLRPSTGPSCAATPGLGSRSSGRTTGSTKVRSSPKGDADQR